MTKILPYSKPLITSFPDIASVFSVIGNHLTNTSAWICDHYINLVAFKDDAIKNNHKWLGNFYDGIGNERITIQAQCPYLERQVVDKNVFLKKDSIDVFIKHCINNEYYIYLYLDLFYIECSECFNNKHLLHPVTIYGYSDEYDTFNIADFFVNNKYMTKVISTKVLKLSFGKLSNFKLNNENIRLSTQMIELYKYKDSNYEMNIEYMLRQLRNYVGANDSFHKLESDGCLGGFSKIYGINYYKTLIEILNNSNGYIDKRNFHLLCDHKALMIYRVCYLLNNNLIKESIYEDLFKQCKALYNDSIILRNKVLMYNIKKGDNLIKSMVELCENLAENDIKMINVLLSAV